MKKHKQPLGFEPGIYFGMGERDYHNDPALSHSGMVSLLESYLDYWLNSPLNPERTFKATDAMIFGTRSHEYLMDEAGFFQKYSVPGRTWELGKVTIATNDFHKIKESIDEIKNVPDVYNHFTLGVPEVTMIVRCRITGIVLRIRIDYMRTFGMMEYKRCRSLQNNLLGRHITDFGYDIQNRLYMDVATQAREELRAGTIKAYGEYDPAFLKAFMGDDDMLCKMLFQRSTAPYIFEFADFAPDVLDNAGVHIEHAKRVYAEGINTYGIKRPPAGNSKTRTFTTYHIGRRIIDRGDHQL